MELVIEILKLVVPTIIALVSLAYAVKQRNVVRREISKKRYLESALSNLNATINSLKAIQNLMTSFENTDEWSESQYVASDVLTASYDLKKKKVALEVSYELVEFVEKDKIRRIQNLDEYTPEWFSDFVKEKDFFLSVDTETSSLGGPIQNAITLSEFRHAIKGLIQTKQNLSTFEEVYENVAPDSVKRFNHLFEEVSAEIFKTIYKPKRIEIDLNKFSETHEIAKYLFEEILGYSHIAERFSKISQLISELERARKELFLKIS